MHLKRLFQLLEAPPLPPDLASRLDLPPGTTYDTDTPNNPFSHDPELEQLFQRLGKGSSRIVFKLAVNSDLFPAADLTRVRALGIKGANIPTAIKFAINAKGVAQNKAEAEAYQHYKSPLVTPIIDTSYRERSRRFKINGVASESSWIQSLAVTGISSTDELNKLAESFFGATPDLLKYAFNSTVAQFHLNFRRRPEDPSYMIEKIKDMAELVNPSNTKSPFRSKSSYPYTNLLELANMLETYRMVPIDLIDPKNWGRLGDRLFVLDFGFNEDTKAIYWDQAKATATVQKDGSIFLKIVSPYLSTGQGSSSSDTAVTASRTLSKTSGGVANEPTEKF